MARYTGPQWKISRRLGFSILENGKELNRRAYAPGQHGQKRKKQTIKVCIFILYYKKGPITFILLF